MSSDTRLQKRPRFVDGQNSDTYMDRSDEEILDDETPSAATKPTYANKAFVMTKPRAILTINMQMNINKLGLFRQP